MVTLCYCNLSLVPLCFFNYQWYPQYIMLITSLILFKFFSVILLLNLLKNQPWLVSYLFSLALPFPSSLILAYSVFIINFLGWVCHFWSSYKAFSSSLLLFFPLEKFPNPSSVFVCTCNSLCCLGSCPKFRD